MAAAILCLKNVSQHLLPMFNPINCIPVLALLTRGAIQNVLARFSDRAQLRHTHGAAANMVSRKTPSGDGRWQASAHNHSPQTTA
mgnify:CR=1 FL=1